MNTISPAGEPVLLEDSRQMLGENLVFWALNSKGYTSDIEQAHRFSAERALWLHATRPSDIAWPASYLADKIRPVIDVQSLLHIERHALPLEGAESATTSRYFLTSANGLNTVGNDVLFSSRDPGKHTTNLNEAMAFSLDQLQNHEKDRIWPAEMVMARSRRAVNRHWIDRSMALSLEMGPMRPQL